MAIGFQPLDQTEQGFIEAEVSGASKVKPLVVVALLFLCGLGYIGAGPQVPQAQKVRIEEPEWFANQLNQHRHHDTKGHLSPFGNIALLQVPAPTAAATGDFQATLPITIPLPAPNPVDNPFVKGYVPMNCQTDSWPFFTEVVGHWVGLRGQNFISLPQQNAVGKFIVEVNSYEEEMTFEAIGGGVLNRGYLDAIQANPTGQSDQVLQGLLYMQKVTDVDLQAGIHEENGQILHKSCVEYNAALSDNWQVMRQGAIPHGSQPMGFGGMKVVTTPSSSYYVQMLLRLRATFEYSVQPFVPGCGPQYEQQSTPGKNTGILNSTKCCLGAGYMKGTVQCPSTGCPEPIDVLIDEVKDLNVVKYTQLDMSTSRSMPPVVPPGDWTENREGGGVQNTAFVNLNAMAEDRSFKNLVFYLTVQNEDGSTYELIQYIQTVNLKFLAKAQNCPEILWPHVDANTLKRLPIIVGTTTTTPKAPQCFKCGDATGYDYVCCNPNVNSSYAPQTCPGGSLCCNCGVTSCACPAS